MIVSFGAHGERRASPACDESSVSSNDAPSAASEVNARREQVARAA